MSDGKTVPRRDNRTNISGNARVSIGHDLIGGNKIVYGNEYNAGRDINVYAPPEPTAKELCQKGVKQLKSGLYIDAALTLKKALDSDDSNRETYYYLAISLLKGKRAKLLTRAEVMEIDSCLARAIARDENDGVFYWFRAILREDYFAENGYTNYPPPTINEIITRAMRSVISKSDFRILLSDLALHKNRLYKALSESLQGDS